MASEASRASRSNEKTRPPSAPVRSGRERVKKSSRASRRSANEQAQASQRSAPGKTAQAVNAPKGKPLGRREATEFRKLLEGERARLLAGLETMKEHAPETEEKIGMALGDGYDEDLVDIASSTFEREKGLALESSVQQMLAQVEQALARIDAGTYGICQRCGGAIDLARLRVLPYGALCIRCKELEEQTSNVR